MPRSKENTSEVKLFLLKDEIPVHTSDHKKDIIAEKSSILKQFFIDNPATFVNLLTKANTKQDLKTIESTLVIDEFNGGAAEDEVVVELLHRVNDKKSKSKSKPTSKPKPIYSLKSLPRSSAHSSLHSSSSSSSNSSSNLHSHSRLHSHNDEEDHHHHADSNQIDPLFENKCKNQKCLLGYITNSNNEYVAIVNTSGQIKYISKTKETNESDDDNDDDEYEDVDVDIEVEGFRSHNQLVNTKKTQKSTKEDDLLEDASDSKNPFKIALKKIKSTFIPPDITKMSLERLNILGQVVNQSKQMANALVIKSPKYGQRLIIIKPIKTLTSIPIYAVMTTA